MTQKWKNYRSFCKIYRSVFGFFASLKMICEMVLTSLSPGIGLSDFSLLLQKVHGQLVMETGGTMLRTKNISPQI